MEVAAISNLDQRPAVEDLVARARTGDFPAFEQLYHRFVGRIHGLCLRLTSDPARAEDATQEAFVNAWRRLETYRADSSFVAWLKRVAINAALSERRSSRRRLSRETPVEDLERMPSATGRPVPGARLDLGRAIATLPAGAREVFVLHDVEGYRHQDVARMLGVAVGTSKAQLHRARRMLREALQ